MKFSILHEFTSDSQTFSKDFLDRYLSVTQSWQEREAVTEILDGATEASMVFPHECGFDRVLTLRLEK